MAGGNTEGKVVGETSSSANSAAESNSEVTKEDLPEIDSLDALQMVLDLAGLVPGLGEGADLLNAAISLGRGDLLGSFFSVVGAIPLVGQGATAAKIAKNADRYMAAVKVVEKKFPWLAEKIKPWLDAVKSKLDDFMGKKASGANAPDSPAGGGHPTSKGGGEPSAPGAPSPKKETGGQVKKWQASEHKGQKVYQRDDLIDPNRVDKRGRTNKERMEKGLAPVGPDGKSIELHHTIQMHDGPVAELTNTFHKKHHAALHINPSSMGSGIDRKAFASWKRSYWKTRASNF